MVESVSFNRIRRKFWEKVSLNELKFFDSLDQTDRPNMSKILSARQARKIVRATGGEYNETDEAEELKYVQDLIRITAENGDYGVTLWWRASDSVTKALRTRGGYEVVHETLYKDEYEHDEDETTNSESVSIRTEDLNIGGVVDVTHVSWRRH